MLPRSTQNVYQELACIGHEINQELETVDLLFQKLYAHAAAILDVHYCFMLAVYQPQSDSLDFHLVEQGRPRFLGHSPLKGGCRWVMEEQKPLIINHLSAERASLPTELIEIPGSDLADPESVIFLPLVLRGVSLGVLSIQSERPNAYGAEDISILEVLSNHVALALSTMRLFHSLLSINETGQLLTRQLDSWKVPQNIVDQIRAVTKADLVILYPYDQAIKQFQFPRCISGKLVNESFPEPRYSRNDDIASLVLKHGEPLFVKNSSTLFSELRGGDAKIRRGNFEAREHVRSVAAVPLLVRDEPVGILFVNFRRYQRFDDPQKQLIQALAHHAAIAIKNIRESGEQTSSYIRRLELLQEIENEIGKSLDLKTILGTILRLATRLIKADDGSILLYNPRTKSLEARAAFGRNKKLRESQVIRVADGEGITLVAFREKRPIRVDNVRTDPKWRSVYHEISDDIVSELDVPLLDQGEVVGVINMESNVGAAFDQMDVQLLNALAIRAVLAIKNAQAYERQKRISKELEAMFSLSEQIINQLDPKDICQSILEKALAITDAVAGNVMLYDLQQDDLWIVAERGVDKDKKDYRQRLGEGVVGRVARDKRLLNVPDVDKVGWADDYIRLIKGARSELAVPILESEKLWGVINIESPAPDHFGQADEQLLSALADMAVLALQNAERYRKVTAKEAQLIALREVDQRIISQLDNPDQVMRTILEGALILNRAEKGYLHLCEQGIVKTIYVAQANGNGGSISVDKDDVVRGEGLRGIVAHVAETQQLYRSSGDAQIDELHDGDLDMHSVVAVPLTVRVGENSEELIGVVSLQSLRTNAFDTDTEEVLKMFATQAVIAIRSASDYDRAEKEVLRFSQLYNTAWELAHITELKKLDKAYDIVMRRADARQESQVIITRYNEDAQELELVRSLRVEGPLHFRHMKVNEGVNGFVARTRETIVLYDTNEPEAKLIPLKPTDTPINSLVVTPIEFEENYYGNLSLSHEQANYFQGTDVELIRGLAKQLAVTIHRLETVQARREAEKRVKEVEVMSSIGQSTFELSHRLGNDLGLVKSYVNNIRSELETSDRTISQAVNDYLNKIVHDVQVVLKLSQQLKIALQEDTKDLLQPEVIPVKELLQEIALCHSNMPTNVAVHVDVDENVEPVKATLDQIKNTLRNLFFNAVEAMPEGGTVTLRARNAGDYVEIEVKDTGIGIAPERQGRIFDLFYSTKGSFGFGLWSARRNALKNGGDLKVKNRSGRGTVFTLSLQKASRREE